MSIITIFAINDYTNGTLVTYTGKGTQEYNVTVPALLKPGQSGVVTLSGTWASDYTVEVISDKTVTLTNDINEEENKILDIKFNGIKEKGDNFMSQSYTETISITEMSEVLFGTWSGVINYQVRVIPMLVQTNQEYVLTYLIDGIEENVFPATMVLNDNHSAEVLIGDNTEHVPANLFLLLGDEIDLGDDELIATVSEDGTTLSLTHIESQLLIAEWTLSTQ
jgi:hypothetical protein